MHLWRTHNFLGKICSRSHRRAAGASKSAYSLRSGERGVTLIDAVVGVALLVIVFVGIFGVFRLAIDVITNNKARVGALALANQRIEYIRALAYTSIGTVSGIPSGAIPQSESVTLNGVNYTRRTLVQYADDPKDGTGAADSNHITADYKAVKVDVSWISQNGTRHIALVSRVSPAGGIETNPCTGPCGTLFIAAVNASSSPLSGASVSIVNSGASPSVNINTFTNASGTVTLIGAPATSGYQITVTQTGYSTAQTYSATAQNTNPNPANLTISDQQTTAGTFGIDVLARKTVRTWNQIQSDSWADSFANDSKISTSTNVTVSGGTAHISTGETSGRVHSVAIAPSLLASWVSLVTTDTQVGSSIAYRLYDGASDTLISDTELPGNSAGFSGGTIDLSGVSTSTHTSLKLDAALSGGPDAPALDSWTLNYTDGPTPLPNIDFTLQGSKTIGAGASGTLYKYSQALNSGAGASLTVDPLEWDTYSISVNGASTGYDIASACQPQPETLYPGTSQIDDLYFAPHTTNSLLVDVRSAVTNELLKNAEVTLTRPGFSAQVETDGCGQAFFSGVTADTGYSLSVSAAGYTTFNGSSIPVSGASRYSVTLN